LSDARLRQRQPKLIYPDHRFSPTLTETATRARSNRLLDGAVREIAIEEAASWCKRRVPRILHDGSCRQQRTSSTQRAHTRPERHQIHKKNQRLRSIINQPDRGRSPAMNGPKKPGRSGARCRKTKLIYQHHRPSPWLTGVAPRDRSNRLLGICGIGGDVNITFFPRLSNSGGNFQSAIRGPTRNSLPP